jgi:hypothetical protein
MICESQSANLALLRWRHDLGLQRHDRLLAVRRLAMAETEPQRWQPPHCDPAQERTQVLQYWQGDAPPEEIQKEIDGWRQKSSLLAHMLWNERQASTWIQENYAADDARRFEQCWHPAMRADFLRILKIAKDGGVYLDCDTPQLHDEGLQRWHQLTQFCVAKNSLALCINTLAGPGYCSHYAVNCCIWSTAEHPFARHWVNAYRQRLDQILATTSRTPGDIHALGPDLLSELLDEMLLSQETSLESIGWNGARIPWLKQGAHSVILLDTDNYRRVFNNPFDGFCSYANCNDPRDWRVKSS